MNGKAARNRWARLGFVVLGAVALVTVVVLVLRDGGRGSAVEPSQDPRAPVARIEGANLLKEVVPDLAEPRRVGLDTGPVADAGVEEPTPQDVWRLRGVVEDEAGVPVQGAEVVLDSAHRDPRVTDESG